MKKKLIPAAALPATAVDPWLLFDNEDEQSAEKSIRKALLLLEEMECK